MGAPDGYLTLRKLGSEEGYGRMHLSGRSRVSSGVGMQSFVPARWVARKVGVIHRIGSNQAAFPLDRLKYSTAASSRIRMRSAGMPVSWESCSTVFPVRCSSKS